jgi:cyclophilin family peptidyl-prolyl cis-trans isomerase
MVGLRIGVGRRIGAACLLVLCIAGASGAQTLRFETNVGSFDMVLNPSNNPNLQPLVDNILTYVGLGRYHFTAINRAADGGPGTADDFVLQMGGFLGFPTAPDLWAGNITPIDTFAGVVTDADNDGNVDFETRSNTRGTVSLALQQDQPNSGTSSFFINLGNNSSILDDGGFVPFATIRNMGTINRILRLEQEDLSDEVGAAGNLAFIDVPLTERNRIVVVLDVDVVDADPNFSFVGPIATALELANRSAAVMAPSAPVETTPPPTVPEPAAATLAAAAATLLAAVRRRFSR